MLPAMVPAGDVRVLREQGEGGECREDGQGDEVREDGAGDHRSNLSNRSPVGVPKVPTSWSCTSGSGSLAVVFGT